MAEYAIVHTSTGVVRRVTIDPDHVIGADETKIEIADKIDWSRGRPKLTARGEAVPATTEDIEAAAKLPLTDEQKNLLTLAAAVQADPTVPATVQAFIAATAARIRPSKLDLF